MRHARVIAEIGEARRELAQQIRRLTASRSSPAPPSEVGVPPLKRATTSRPATP